ncbi:putative phosphonate metabolism protein [Rhodopseudomonas julia]|uniref:Phosphonate metabolism protein n=1 Tax=Rhodopseudomonas julia TaxID=200617 RepID=A0ABU0C6U9_9BRAD|nr:DUF1045 domain-containing protein [Rhodopseudomonas julia]MDQ0326253.1 putative phosphonate metabolism protein [Rhodopseudomonas julia]
MRVALYFTPALDHPVTQAANDWIGRDLSDGPVEQKAVGALSAEEVRAVTDAPRRYGFHATLKPPFALHDGVSPEDVEQALRSFCAEHGVIELGPLEIRAIGPFFALVPQEDVPAVRALADAAVEAFEPFRAPLSDDDRARRRPEELTERQREYLDRWGYPYVFDEFRFHMTLTGPVSEERRSIVEGALHQHFGSVIETSLALDGVSLLTEPERGAFFQIHARCNLRGPSERKSIP